MEEELAELREKQSAVAQWEAQITEIIQWSVHLLILSWKTWIV